MDSIVRWLKQELLAYIDPGVPDDDYELMVSVSHCNILRWFDALDRLSAQQREPVVRVYRLVWSEPYLNEIKETAVSAHSSCGRYIASDHGWFLCGLTQWNEATSIEASKSAAQADYEQRIMAAIEIIPAGAGTSSDGGVEGHAVATHDGGSPGPSPLAVTRTSSDPASGRSQPSPDVSVDDLLLRLDASQKACFDAGLHVAAMDIQSARALLSRYSVGRRG